MFGFGFLGLGVEGEFLGLGFLGFDGYAFLYFNYDDTMTFNFLSTLELIKRFVVVVGGWVVCNPILVL